jgi:hypothetical protein
MLGLAPLRPRSADGPACAGMRLPVHWAPMDDGLQEGRDTTAELRAHVRSGCDIVHGLPEYPGQFVVVSWTARMNSTEVTKVEAAPTLDEARRLVPAGMVRLDLHDSDHPTILEVWVEEAT